MTERRWFALILGIYLLLAFGYSLLMPIWEAPDERAHYGYALQLAREGAPPTFERNYEAFQPPSYYWLVQWPLRILDGIEPGWVNHFKPDLLPAGVGGPRYDWDASNYRTLPGPLLLRWINILLGAASVYFIYRGARRLLPEHPSVALASAALTGGIPQILHITSSVNNDNLAILLGALFFWALAEVLQGEIPLWSLVLFGLAGLALPPLVKLTALPLGATLLLAAGWQIRARLEVRILWLVAAIMGSGALVAVGLRFMAPEVFQMVVAEFEYRLLSTRGLPLQDSVIGIIFRFAANFWGRVGWAGATLPRTAILLLTVLALAGGGWSLRQLWLPEERRTLPGKRSLWGYLWLALAITLAMVVRNIIATPRYQGRFFFPSLGPLSLVVVAGWYTLLPARWRPYLLPGILVLMTLMTLVLWFGGVIPLFYQPFLDGN